MKKRIALILGTALVLLVLYDFSSLTRSCGKYELSVEIPPELAAEVSHVYYYPYNGKTDFAETIIANLDESLPEMRTATASGNAFISRINHSHKTSALGRNYGYVQSSHLIVVLEQVDETRRVYDLAIPPKADSRRVVLSAENQVSEKTGSVIPNH